MTGPGQVSGSSAPRPTDHGERTPLSYAQERLWITEQDRPDTPLYNLPLAFSLRGALDGDALRSAVEAFIARHEIMRTTFAVQDGTPLQCIAREAAIELPTVPVESRPGALRDALARRANEPFRLDRGPLLRAALLRRSAGEHVLFFMPHHILFDGWSLSVFLDELSILYPASAGQTQTPIPDVPLQYADYALWERSRLQGERLEAGQTFWEGELAGALPHLGLPADRPRPPVRGHHGATEWIDLPESLTTVLQQAARPHGATLFMLLLAAYAALLQRYTAQDEIVVGCPVANRIHPALTRTVGFFVNSIPVRIRTRRGQGFGDLLDQVRDTCLRAFEHQHVPLQHILARVRPPRDPGRTPLFQTLFSFENTSQRCRTMGDIAVERVPVPHDSALTDLTVTVACSGTGLQVGFNYATDLFDAATIRQMMAHYGNLLQAVADRPDARVGELALLSPAELRRVTVEWNASAAAPADTTIHACFEQQAAARPDAVAVEMPPAADGTDAASLTYAELNRRADRLARRLRASGVAPGAVVALCAERSLDIPAALLAILKTGAAYLPLDPSDPPERLALVIEDARPVCILAQAELRERLSKTTVAILTLGSEKPANRDPGPAGDPAAAESSQAENGPSASDKPGRPAGPDSLAYIMYTSGSTGRPKGVMIPHRGVVRLVRQPNYVDLSSATRTLLFAPLTFDASTFEIWAALLNGGCLTVFPAGRPTIAALGRTVEQSAVNTLWLSAELFRTVVNEDLGALRQVRQLVTGGDVLPVAQVRRALQAMPGCRLVNGYGPTENTTFTCCHTVAEADTRHASIPIGRPVSGSTVYIVDPDLRPVPPGVPGELVTGGDGVALGYLNRPELTSRSFPADPFSGQAGARLYRTGDRARRRRDGTVEFLGRMDRQIKIRGFRVEPGETEAIFNSLAEIRRAAVLAQPAPGGGRELCGFYSLQDRAALTVTDLRRRLRRHLPDYMIPRRMIELDGLPVTANGKIDRAALARKGQAAARPAPVAQPRTDAERYLADLWQELLATPAVGRNDNFFRLGGHSLLAMQTIERVRRETGSAVTPHELLVGTLAQVAAKLTLPPPGAPPSSTGRSGGGLLAAIRRLAHRRGRC